MKFLVLLLVESCVQFWFSACKDSLLASKGGIITVC